MAWGLNVSSVLDGIGCSQPRSVLYPNSWFSLVDACFGGFFLLFAFSVAGIDCLAILDSRFWCGETGEADVGPLRFVRELELQHNTSGPRDREIL